MTIKEMRNITGMTQKEFANYFNIPLKTYQHWEAGTSKPAPYLLNLIQQSLPQLEDDIMIIRYFHQKFFYDKKTKCIIDEHNMKIFINIELEKICPTNLGTYVSMLFDDYYKSYRWFKDSCENDHGETEWIKFE